MQISFWLIFQYIWVYLELIQLNYFYEGFYFLVFLYFHFWNEWMGFSFLTVLIKKTYFFYFIFIFWVGNLLFFNQPK